MCDAHKFEEWVKTHHRVPQDPVTWRELGVKETLSKRAGSVYKPMTFYFSDNSAYERPKVYCACQKSWLGG